MRFSVLESKLLVLARTEVQRFELAKLVLAVLTFSWGIPELAYLTCEGCRNLDWQEPQVNTSIHDTRASLLNTQKNTKMKKPWKALSLAYIRPHLEYALAVWDHHQQGLINSCMCTKNWGADYDFLLQSCNVSTLKKLLEAVSLISNHQWSLYFLQMYQLRDRTCLII